MKFSKLSLLLAPKSVKGYNWTASRGITQGYKREEWAGGAQKWSHTKLGPGRKPCRASLTPAARRQALGLVYLISSSSQRFISQNALLQLIQLPAVGQVTDLYVRHTTLHFAFPRPPRNSSPAHSHFLFRRPIKELEFLQSLISIFLVAPPIAWSFWELQFESISRPGGVFGSTSVPRPSNVELQVPESLEKAVVKLPVELAQDDSWRMESGNGSGFW